MGVSSRLQVKNDRVGDVPPHRPGQPRIELVNADSRRGATSRGDHGENRPASRGSARDVASSRIRRTVPREREQNFALLSKGGAVELRRCTRWTVASSVTWCTARVKRASTRSAGMAVTKQARWFRPAVTARPGHAAGVQPLASSPPEVAGHPKDQAARPRGRAAFVFRAEGGGPAQPSACWPPSSDRAQRSPTARGRPCRGSGRISRSPARERAGSPTRTVVPTVRPLPRVSAIGISCRPRRRLLSPTRAAGCSELRDAHLEPSGPGLVVLGLRLNDRLSRIRVADERGDSAGLRSMTRSSSAGTHSTVHGSSANNRAG